MSAYPPYQHPFLDARTRLVTKPWQLFFLRLAGDAGTIDAGSVTLAQLAPLSGAPRLLGRGSAGAGPVEELTIGDGLTMTGTELSAIPVEDLGYWTPITNGDPLSPEILFDAEGDCVVGWVPTP
jgi:hypothetical protein